MRRLLALLLPLLVLAPSGSAAAAAPPAGAPAGEELEYSWRLEGLLGGIAGLFLPRQGRATLAQTPLASGHQVSELHLVADGTAEGEHFRYGAELDPESGVTVRAWSSYRWRGETKQREAEVGQAGVVDIASAIQALRRDPPEHSRVLEIWSDGRIYPVLVLAGESRRRLLDGRPVEVRVYSIRGLSRPNRRTWKGRVDLWLADDPASTPVEIRVQRTFATVVLSLSR
ncbi:MAG: DUF3108 domain-containing protein [Thermoanaerobaculia bacterium]|nr:DUF3108 domain-containing protein [Thermoanaerobaculia bacterium]